METATKQKLKTAIELMEMGALRGLPIGLVCIGLIMTVFMASVPSSAWSSSPALMMDGLNLSVFLVFGGLIWMDVQRVLARLDALREAP